MIMKLNNNIEFLVSGVIDLGNRYEITFGEGISYQDVQPIYDPSSDTFSKDTLRRIELINESTKALEGIHVGYTEVVNISCINNIVTILIDKEHPVVTELEAEKLNIKQLKSISAQQDIYLLETDLRIMDIETALGMDIIPINISLYQRGSSFDLLMRLLEDENFTSKELMKNNIDIYLSRGRITEDEYNILINTLDKI